MHLTLRQRGADAAALGNLLLYVPNFLCSLLVMMLVCLPFGGIGWLVLSLWLASGALVFHRPTEGVIARRLLGLRHPLPEERATLIPVWREVAARAGVDADTYELWIEDSNKLNAVAAAGHVLGVTRFAVTALHNGELAAVLAHELGHHVGGHAWSGLLGHWYALPGRVAWRIVQVTVLLAIRIAAAFSCVGILVLLAALGYLAIMMFSWLHGLPLLIVAVPYALAAVSRRAELRADRHAAVLGFASMLSEVLTKLHNARQQDQTPAGRRPATASTSGPLSRLLSSHPDYATRLHHLRPYLVPPIQ